ncbi:MAG: AsmA family protein [Alphaproteobacteria bacterium]
MRKVFIGLFIIIGLLVAAIAIVPSLIPSSVYKEKIQMQLSKELARDVTIDGEVKLSVFPSIRAKTGRVVIANPDGFESAHFASMDGLDAKIKLIPLLSKRVEIASFTLRKPDINLEKKSDGEANWVLGTPKTDEEVSADTNTVDDGPFKRDGRYAEIDPAIGQFTLEDGAISYKDATTDTSYDLRSVNLRFSLPSLSKPVEITGDVIVNDEPVKIDMTLNSPRAFLDGKQAPVSLNLSTNFMDVKAKGEFLQSEAIAFKLNLDGNISDVAALSLYIPSELPVAQIAKTASLKGDYHYDGSIFSGSGTDIQAKGDLIDAVYRGSFTLADKPVLDGEVSLDAKNIAKLASLFGKQINGLELAQSAKVTASLAAKGTGFTANNIDAAIKGDGIDATFKGSGTYAETLLANGNFTATAASIPAIIDALKLDIPQAKAAKNLDVKGTVVYNGNTTKLSGLEVASKGGVVEGQYTGDITLGEALAFAGVFDSQVTSLDEFSAASGMDIPYANAIGKISAKGAVNGAEKSVKITELEAQLQDGDINGSFQGGASMNNGFSVDGLLNADIPSIRTLATKTGTILPASTQIGPIYEAFAISGNVKGTPSDIGFTGADITLDHLKGKGNFSVDLKGAKPFVSGVLDMEGLDLRPYMASYAAQNPTGEIQPWSDQPLNMTMLKAIDGDFKFNTPSMTTDRLKMGAANVDAKLRNGILNTEVPKLNMYGGLGSVTASLNANGAVPAVALDLKMSDLNSNAFLSAVAGFTNATGEGGTVVSIRGSGASQAALMKSLSGSGDFKLLNGQISGVDLSQLLTGLDQALTSRTLPSGIGSQYTTKFNDIAGLFTIENGVAKIGNFSLSGLGVAAQGAGEIDLGGQAVDFSLRPHLTGKSAGDLASFGIPIRVKGGFGDASVGLDTQLLTQIAAAKAKSRLQQELTNQVGGSVGNILGGILGGNTQTPSTETPTPTTETPATKTPSQQQSTEEAVSDLLGGLFGKKTKEKPKPETEKKE